VSEPGTSGAPGLVVIQEWWGLNEQIKRTADRFAQAGYRAVVPDLFRGKLASDADEASHMMNGLNFLDATDQDVAACVNYLRRDARRCGVTGFCMGGALTIFSALRVSGVDAGACFYGIPPRELADPSKIQVPMILHFAKRDDWCTPSLVDALEKDLAKSSSKYSLYRYDAQHAFMNQARPEVYDEACAKLAWDRTLSFLEGTLKS
jgi:carboxymethylenebutenolidase